MAAEMKEGASDVKNVLGHDSKITAWKDAFKLISTLALA